MGTALVASNGEAEFGTLRGEASGIKQWERCQALCIHRADLLYAVKYTGFMYTQGGASQIKILD